MEIYRKLYLISDEKKSKNGALIETQKITVPKILKPPDLGGFGL